MPKRRAALFPEPNSSSSLARVLREGIAAAEIGAMAGFLLES